MSRSNRLRAGALIHDLPRYLLCMRPRWLSRGHLSTWVQIRNRNERLVLSPDRAGARCDWQWTSDLHLARVFPYLGLRLMKRALQDWQITMISAPEAESMDSAPQVSFVIGHRGLDRLQHLLATLGSIAAQRGCSFECVVVEQAAEPQIAKRLPDWVTYVHTPLPYPEMPYNRSWAFNVGASRARGDLLILHDNDLLVPQSYAAEALKLFNQGCEVINLKRFIFYLGPESSRAVASQRLVPTATPPSQVMQNAQAGGSVAVGRRAYFELGGFDESFVGWGGEDNEFWDRAQTRLVWPYAYLPIVHLSHPPQPEKLDRQRHTAQLLEEKLSTPAKDRVERLCRRNFPAVGEGGVNPASVGASGSSNEVDCAPSYIEHICAE